MTLLMKHIAMISPGCDAWNVLGHLDDVKPKPFVILELLVIHLVEELVDRSSVSVQQPLSAFANANHG